MYIDFSDLPEERFLLSSKIMIGRMDGYVGEKHVELTILNVENDYFELLLEEYFEGKCKSITSYGSASTISARFSRFVDYMNK